MKTYWSPEVGWHLNLGCFSLFLSIALRQSLHGFVCKCLFAVHMLMTEPRFVDSAPSSSWKYKPRGYYAFSKRWSCKRYNKHLPTKSQDRIILVRWLVSWYFIVRCLQPKKTEFWHWWGVGGLYYNLSLDFSRVQNEDWLKTIWYELKPLLILWFLAGWKQNIIESKSI